MTKCGLDNLLTQLELKGSDAVFLKNKEDKFDVFLHFDIKKKLDLINPDAIYVFNKQPFILFFDLTDDKNTEREDEIHKKVWSFDNSPVIFVLKGKEIIVYNALNYAKKDNRLEAINIPAEKINELFSFWNLQSGSTWQWLQEEALNNDRKKTTQKRVNERLFQNIKEVRNHLTSNENPLEEKDANLLVLRLIFIRYLIDRGVEINKDYIYGEKNDRRKRFCELITQPERLNSLFEYLNGRFNGILFKDSIRISEEQAEFLQGVFSGEPQKGDILFEGSFFEIFDFSIIPVELISGIYESLLDEEKRKLDSAVYTPSFLVDYILTDTVDKYLNSSQTSDCKVFEVSVGSGIFLVQSLRRMIEKEIELNGNEDKKKFSERIKEIAEDNLFGIDINKEALKVTCFSIYIALLDYIEPKDINQKYLFPHLIDTNLFEANFFDTEHSYNRIIRDKKPNFILGNPPWKNGSNDPVHVKYLTDNKLRNVVSDYQLAQSFLLRTKDFSKSLPICSLIVTSKAFYNNKATSFKEKFLADFYLRKCLDLSCIRRLIFKDADNPAMILQYQHANGEDTGDNIVYHSSLKHNLFIKNYKLLAFEKNDLKEIKQKYFIKYRWLFKVALYGNALDFSHIRKLSDNIFSLGNYLERNKHNTDFGKGIEMGNPKKTEPFSFLENFHLIEKNSFSPFFINTNHTRKLNKEDVFLKAGRRLSLFDGKKIILGKRTIKESNIKNAIAAKGTAFTENFYGITSSSDKILYPVFALINSDLYLYYQYLTSANWGVYNPELNLNEYLSFPFLEPNEKAKTELINLVNQFLKPFQGHCSAEFNLGEPQPNKEMLTKINNIINDLYGIKGYEKDLITYVLDVSRYQFQESKQEKFTRKVNLDKPFLENYANVYLQEFGKIYDDEFIQVEIYSLNHFIAMKFNFSDTEPTEKFVYQTNQTEKRVFDFFVNKLSISQETNTANLTESLFIQKDIKGFEENSFYIIKPNEYKCWHRAMAWYDVAEFMEKIEVAEVKRFSQIEE